MPERLCEREEASCQSAIGWNEQIQDIVYCGEPAAVCYWPDGEESDWLDERTFLCADHWDDCLERGEPSTAELRRREEEKRATEKRGSK